MKRNIYTATIILYLVVLISSMNMFAVASNSINAKSTTSENSSTSLIKVQVLEAYYTDLDGDLLEDDVYALTSINLSGTGTYTFDYIITLTLPSGISFTYSFVITTNIEQLKFNNNFFDHALEPGYYKIDLDVKLHTGGQFKDAVSYEFDPPGGACCSDPTFTLT